MDTKESEYDQQRPEYYHGSVQPITGRDSESLFKSRVLTIRWIPEPNHCSRTDLERNLAHQESRLVAGLIISKEGHARRG